MSKTLKEKVDYIIHYDGSELSDAYHGLQTLFRYALDGRMSEEDFYKQYETAINLDYEDIFEEQQYGLDAGITYLCNLLYVKVKSVEGHLDSDTAKAHLINSFKEIIKTNKYCLEGLFNEE